MTAADRPGPRANALAGDDSRGGDTGGGGEIGGDELEDLLLELLDGVVRIASPAGGELPAARWLAGRLAELEPDLALELDEFAPGRANLTWGDASGGDRSNRARPGTVLLYSHLDTSLSGDRLLDRPVTAGQQRLSVLERRDGLLAGPGVAVAKGPAVAATLGLLLAHRADPARAAHAHLLLAAGGTHRAPPGGLADPAGAPCRGSGDGVRRYLSQHRPAAAVVAKCGPPTVLHEEPGAAYLQVEIAGTPGVVMARGEPERDGGVPSCAGAAVSGVEGYRRVLLARPVPPGSQAGRELGVGALQAGISYKPDLFAGLLVLGIYAVLAPGDDAATLAAELESSVRAALARHGRPDLEVTARVLETTGPARTDPDSLVVRVAHQVWFEDTGAAPPPITGWTGSTDGVLLRAAGIDTVRLGPRASRTAGGDEAVELADLVAATRRYAALVLAFGSACRSGARGRQRPGAPAPSGRLALRDSIPPMRAAAGGSVERGRTDVR